MRRIVAGDLPLKGGETMSITSMVIVVVLLVVLYYLGKRRE
jgi:hypothetical protein